MRLPFFFFFTALFAVIHIAQVRVLPFPFPPFFFIIFSRFFAFVFEFFVVLLFASRYHRATEFAVDHTFFFLKVELRARDLLFSFLFFFLLYAHLWSR